MKRYEKFTKEQLQEMLNDCRSFRQFCIKLGYSTECGSAVKAVKECISKYGLDGSHLKGKGWLAGDYDYSKFRNGHRVVNARDALIALRGHRCECCGNTEWNGQPIPLQVHHIDGNHMNNELDNLQLLCPNCHAQTDNYCGKNVNVHPTVQDYIDIIVVSHNISEALRKLGVNGNQKWYRDKVKDIMERYSLRFIE